MNVPNDWLQNHTHLLVDMSDLILIQDCIKKQKDDEWFDFGQAGIASLLGVQVNKAVRRRKRWLRDGLIEQRKFNDPKRYLYRLCDL